MSDAPPLLRRVLVTLVLGGLLLGLGSFTLRTLAAAKQDPEQVERAERPIAVRVRRAERTTHTERLVGYGRARPLRQARVAAEVAGVVEWISSRLEAGAAVEKDEELVRLDPRDFVQALESAKSRLVRNAAQKTRLEVDLRSAEKQLEVARRELAASQRELERIRNLMGSAAVTESDLDRQSMETSLREAAVVRFEGNLESFAAQIATTEAEAAELEAARQKAEYDLGRTTVRAPFGGRLQERLVDRGERVAVGTALFDLIDPAALEIPVALPASSYGHVGVGAPARVRLGDQVSPGAVVRVAPAVRPEDRTYYAYLEPEAASSLPPGAFVTAEIEARVFDDVFVVPREAVVGGCFFVAEEGVARMRKPVVRAVLPSVLLASGGVEPGEEIILTNLEEIADGTRVAPVRDES